MAKSAGKRQPLKAEHGWPKRYALQVKADGIGSGGDGGRGGGVGGTVG